MKRFGLTILIFHELAAMAGLAIGMRFGRFDLGAGFYVYVLGALVGVAIVAGFALPARIGSRAAVHGVLLLGCALFAMPFVWLLSTSFKYDEELLAFPPRWAPSIPRAVLHSPYLTGEDSPPVEADAAAQAALWDHAKPLLPPDALRTFPEPAVRDAIVRALWRLQRIDPEAVEGAWDAVHRGVMLRDVAITDDDGISRNSAPSAQQWNVLAGDATLTRVGDRGGATALRYDLSTTPRITLSADLPLPISPDRLLSFSLPLRQDRSWHALGVAIEFNGKRYTATDSLYLGERRWQELTFRLQHKDARDERDVGIYPLSESKDPTPAFSAPNQLRLTLTLDRASQPVATWRKFTHNYVSAYLASGHRWSYVFNSLYLVVLTVIGQVLSCSMVAYAFARLRWPGRDVLFIVMLATMMLPPQVTMVPVFVIFKHLGLYNTLAALWAPSFLGTPLFIFLLRQFMKTIPSELEDAAKIDGCGYFTIFFRVILPLTKPALAAVAIFAFMNTWNDFMGPLIYINDQRLYPLSLGLFELRTSPRGTDYGMLMAASTLMTLPVIALFFAGQRYFIEGVTLTGMKA